MVRLVTAAGETLDLEAGGRRGAVVDIELPSIGEGTHAVAWRVVSDDGHPVGGSLVFSVGTATTSAAPNVTGTDPVLRGLIWSARVAVYLGLFIGAAGAFFAAWIGASAPTRGLKRALRIFLAIGLIATPVALVLQGLDLLGAPLSRAFDPATWRATTASTFTFTLAVAAAAIAAGLLSLNSGRRAARALSLVSLLGIGLAFALSGHVSTAPPRPFTGLIVAAHTIAVAFWVGALMPLLVTMRGVGPEAQSTLSRFSATVPFAILALLAAGVALVVVQVTAPSDLWLTPYGRVLFGKLAIVAALLAVAIVNRVGLTPLARANAVLGHRALRRSIAVELGLVFAVFGLVALWRFTPPPRVVAATPVAVAPEPTARRTFFQHVMTAAGGANVTVAPAVVGPVNLSIELMTAEEMLPLAALEVAVTMLNRELDLELSERTAALGPDGTWEAGGFLVPFAGVWSVEIEYLVSDFDRRSLSVPILIYGADGGAPAP